MADKKKVSDQYQYQDQIWEDQRPWGKFRSFPHTSVSSIKIITVNPAESLSLQYHDHRSEYWIVLDSGLEVTVGEKVWSPQANEEIFIPEKTPHRIRGIGQKPARILEFWLGNSDESDIVRLEDSYGRE